MHGPLPIFLPRPENPGLTVQNTLTILLPELVWGSNSYESREFLTVPRKKYIIILTERTYLPIPHSPCILCLVAKKIKGKLHG